MAIVPLATGETVYVGSFVASMLVPVPAGDWTGKLIEIEVSDQENPSAPSPTGASSGFVERYTEGGDVAFRPVVTKFWKIGNGTEGGTNITITWAAATARPHGVSKVWDGVDAVNPYDIAAAVAVLGSSNPNPGPVTTVTDGAAVTVTVCGNRAGGTTATISAGYSTTISQATDDRFVIATHRIVATAAAEDPAVWAALIDNSTAVTDALRPSAAGIDVTATRADAAGRAVSAAIAPSPQSPAATRADAGAVTRPPVVTAVAEPSPAFPIARLGFRVEAAFGAGASSPLGWTWTDLSDRKLNDPVGIRKGRANESAVTQPSSLSATLDNGDGALTPNNPTSPYWPNVTRGTPLRTIIEGATPALIIPGQAGAYASTPNHSDFDFGGDFDVRIHVEPDQWSGSDPNDQQVLISKADFAGEFSWDFGLRRGGQPQLLISSNGTGIVSVTGTLNRYASLKPIWVAVAFEAANNGDQVMTFYRYDLSGPPPADVTSWELVDIAVRVGVTGPLHVGTADVEIGAINNGAVGLASLGFRGRVLATQIRDGINGTVVADPDFTAQTPGTTAFIDSTGKVWSVNGAASISRERIQFVGKVDDLEPFWPHGDNNPTGAGGRPSEARVAINASGPLRRLSQGSKPLRSALYRHLTASQQVDEGVAVPLGTLAGYWPCEDDPGAVRLGSALPGGPPIVLTGKVGTAADNTLISSAALPSIASGDTGSWAVDVPAPAVNPPSAWAVEFVFRLPTPETNPATTQLIEITTAGTAVTWRLTMNDTTFNLIVKNAGGGDLVNASVAVQNPSPYAGGPWVLATLRVSELAGTISWVLLLEPLDTGLGQGASGSFAGTIGRVLGVANSIVGPVDGLAFGHIMVHNNLLESGWLAGAVTAWAGESAARRFYRLCAEEGVPVEIIGDAALPFLGDLGLSEAMGPQLRETLSTLLTDCARVDLGVIIERRRAPGLVYRTRATLEAQAAALVLDASLNQIALPFTPRLDDQRIRNDVTVASASGSSARVIDQSSIDVEGLYDTEIKIAGVGGVAVQDVVVASQPGLAAAINTQNIQQAAWRLHLGTAPEMRYPSVTIDLALASPLIDTWLDLVDLGDRIIVRNLPVQHPIGDVDLLLDAVNERLTPTHWTVQLTGSPGGPWQVGILDD